MKKKNHAKVPLSLISPENLRNIKKNQLMDKEIDLPLLSIVSTMSRDSLDCLIICHSYI